MRPWIFAMLKMCATVLWARVWMSRLHTVLTLNKTFQYCCSEFGFSESIFYCVDGFLMGTRLKSEKWTQRYWEKYEVENSNQSDFFPFAHCRKINWPTRSRIRAGPICLTHVDCSIFHSTSMWTNFVSFLRRIPSSNLPSLIQQIHFTSHNNKCIHSICSMHIY